MVQSPIGALIGTVLPPGRLGPGTRVADAANQKRTFWRYAVHSDSAVVTGSGLGSILGASTWVHNEDGVVMYGMAECTAVSPTNTQILDR